MALFKFLESLFLNEKGELSKTKLGVWVAAAGYILAAIGIEIPANIQELLVALGVPITAVGLRDTPLLKKQ